MSLIKNLNKSYTLEGGVDFSLRVPELEISDTGITCITGPSGSGKSSFLRVLIGLEEAEGFSWLFDSVDLAQMTVEERRLGVVYQKNNLFPHMSALENILFALQARKKKVDRSKIDELACKLGVQNILKTKARYLSGGEEQRMALLRSILITPRLLLLDEPFSALDEENKKEARKLVRWVADEYGVPVLLVTHDKVDVQLLADHILTLQNGELKPVD